MEAPAKLTVLFGSRDRALPEGAKEFDCDAIVLPRVRGAASADCYHATGRHQYGGARPARFCNLADARIVTRPAGGTDS